MSIVLFQTITWYLTTGNASGVIDYGSTNHTTPRDFLDAPVDSKGLFGLDRSWPVFSLSARWSQRNPLAFYQEGWRKCSAHPWVLATVTECYRLQFSVKPPPFNGVIRICSNRGFDFVLEVEIASLLEKRAIRRIPVGETQNGYYSCYFLIPKKDRG